jgi:NMD protein affecting ribosome stability and mRNA decay
MITGVIGMMCGNCGFETFRVYKTEDALHIECRHCKSVTVVQPSKPHLELNWGEKAHGILAPKG